MGSFKKQCEAISRSTGEQCRQPAVRGFDYCRFHSANKDGSASGVMEPVPDESRKGAQPGNANALKHGAYSGNLLPEEMELYNKKREEFIA